MKKPSYNLFYLFILCFTVVFSSYSQSEKNTNEYYTWFDSIIGDSNNDLYNGPRYVEEYRTEDGNHKFFLSQNYIAGNVTYNNQTFYNVQMKYDLYRDNLIVKLPNQSNSLVIKLIKEKVDSFTLFGYTFVNLPKFRSDNGESSTNSFYRELHKTSKIKLYKKYYKTRAEFIKDYKLYSKFSDRDYYAFYYKGEYTFAGKKKDFIRVFPSLKKVISSYYRDQRNLYKSDKDNFYINLIEKINSSNTSNNN